ITSFNTEAEVCFTGCATGIGYPTATVRLRLVRSDSDVDGAESHRVCGPVSVRRFDLDVHDVRVSRKARQERKCVAVGIDRHIADREVGCAAQVARLEDLKPNLRERD